MSNFHTFEKVDTLGSQAGKWTFIFNKLTGALISSMASASALNPEENEDGSITNPDVIEIEDIVDTTYAVYKVVEDFDPNTQMWVGDYETGGIINIEEAPRKILETGLDASAGQQIRQKHEYYHQLNTISNLVKRVAEELGVSGEAMDDFLLMRQGIAEVRSVNNRYKDAYKNDPAWEYIDKQKQKQLLDDQIAGGLHEVIGPKTTGVEV